MNKITGDLDLQVIGNTAKQWKQWEQGDQYDRYSIFIRDTVNTDLYFIFLGYKPIVINTNSICKQACAKLNLRLQSDTIRFGKLIYDKNGHKFSLENSRTTGLKFDLPHLISQFYYENFAEYIPRTDSLLSFRGSTTEGKVDIWNSCKEIALLLKPKQKVELYFTVDDKGKISTTTTNLQSNSKINDIINQLNENCRGLLICSFYNCIGREHCFYTNNPIPQCIWSIEIKNKND